MVGNRRLYNDCEVNFEYSGNGFANGVHQQPAFARYGKEDTNTEYQQGMVGTGIKGHQEATRQNRTWNWLFKAINSCQIVNMESTGNGTDIVGTGT